MSDGEPPQRTPEHVPEPSWPEKVVRISEALAAQGVPYAFGGAIALNYHREPRSTVDIDINIFLAPENAAQVLETLNELYDVDRAQVEHDLHEQGQARSRWRSTLIDLFFANTEFHESMAMRIQLQPFGDAEIPVLSIEDLLVCKVLFDRPKDWVDIEAVVATRQTGLDAMYIRTWTGLFLPPDDARLTRLEEVLR